MPVQCLLIPGRTMGKTHRLSTFAKLAPKPPEPVWTLRRADHVIEAALCERPGYGIEFQLRRDGEFFYSYRFDLRSDALSEAVALRQVFEANGWTCILKCDVQSLA